jgi:hemoglobin/transferrin/lactoferrin receptor protein
MKTSLYNYIKSFSVVLFFAFSSQGWAQEIQVINKVTLEPIKDVFVYVNARSFYESTNTVGKVNLVGIQSSDTVFFQHPSFVLEFITLEKILANGAKINLTQKVVLIEEVIISASKSPEVISEVGNQIEIISKGEIIFRNPQTAADLLSQSGEVFVQKSQLGGGSPVLRGFEANAVLLVVDGVRQNNAIYRSGHLQNSITIDPTVIERTEVVFGPGSVIYGSDAIGGVMHFVTQDPLLAYDDKKLNLKFNGFSRYSSANKEKTIGGNINFGFKKWGSLTAFSYSQFEDLKMGANRGFSPEGWGLLNYYVDRIDGRDTILANPNPLIQKFSGYSQWNVMQKFKIQTSENLSFGINFQASSSSDIPRFEQLNDITYSIDVPFQGVFQGARFAEWYYGPQKRVMGAFDIEISNKKMFDNANIVAAAQSLEESRVSRRFDRVQKIFNIEKVNVASLNGDFIKRIVENNELKYGFEFQYNHVASLGRIDNIETNESIDLNEPTRYPDGGSNTQNYGFYIMDKWKPRENITLNAGIRYNHSVMISKFTDTSLVKLPTPNFHFSRGAISGSVSLIYIPIEGLELKINAGTGFRSPNVDDYGKIRAQGDEISIPNLDLKPEYVYNAEIGIIKNFNKIARISLTGYYTHLSDAIGRAHIQVDGKDSLMYDGEMYYIITTANVQNARVLGFSIGFDTDIGKYVSLTANLNYTNGKELPSKLPMAHIPPLFGKVSLLAKVKRFQMEVYAHYNAQKEVKNYSPTSTEDRLDEATLSGTPSWFTVNLRTTAQLHKNLSLQVGIENLLDQHYKPFASGISAAGRNFIVTLRGKL